jgi:hypothetical protein
MSTSPPASVPPDLRRRPFDERIAARLQAAAQEALADEPDTRSIAIAIDYAGRANEGNPISLIWIGTGPNGQVVEPPAIVNSLQQTLKLAELQLQQLVRLAQQWQQRVEADGAKLVQLRRQMEEVSHGQAVTPPT